MSTEPTEDDTTDHEPGPPTVGAILDDAREAIDEPPIDPSYHTSRAEPSALSATTHLPFVDSLIEEDEVDDLGLAPYALAVFNRHDDAQVTLRVGAEGGGDSVGMSARLDATEARSLALQLLASAAVVDDTTDGPEGYLTE